MIYEVIRTDIFYSWYTKLKDPEAKARIRMRLERASHGNFGDWVTEAGEVKAMRIHYGPGYRLYYVIRGSKVVFLLCGGDKRTQSADIKRAVEFAKGV